MFNLITDTVRCKVIRCLQKIGIRYFFHWYELEEAKEPSYEQVWRPYIITRPKVLVVWLAIV